MVFMAAYPQEQIRLLRTEKCKQVKAEMACQALVVDKGVSGCPGKQLCQWSTCAGSQDSVNYYAYTGVLFPWTCSTWHTLFDVDRPAGACADPQMSDPRGEDPNFAGEISTFMEQQSTNQEVLGREDHLKRHRIGMQKSVSAIH